MVICTLAAAVLGILYSMAESGTQVVIVGFLLVFFIGVMIGIGWAIYIPELFPTEVRMRGAGSVNTVGRIVSIATPYAVVALFGAWGISGVVLTLSAILLLTALTVAFFGIETRRRSLEDLRPDVDDAPLLAGAFNGPSA